ncbi:P26 [Maruca vitrata nucleopolyhedrovirus]|uniref:p26 n=1 Tax=Maruca vitrata nucleopolyhedrovirus TaxID=1307954 RepID=A1YRG6_9ABAC|nr:P26 [Maruca vitrata nucleopolyhedrovirus]ABM05420.1 P26 [Maruca vitrata nucleopolyhedrovirus]
MELYNIKYAIDPTNKIVIEQVDNVNVFVRTLEPGQEVFNETLSQYHQFPGVISSIIFPQVELNDEISVLTDDGSLLKLKLECTGFNFHVCNKRFVFGNLPAAVVNCETKQKLRIGAPIFANEKLISVVTAFHHVCENEWLLPVTGIREMSQMSGHMKAPNGVRVEKWRPGTSVYGTVQLPYDKIKQYALEQENKMPNTLESCVIFFKDSEVRITYNKGEYEIMQLRVPGPLIQPNSAYYD